MKAVIGMLVIITISVVVAIYFLCFESEEQVINKEKADVIIMITITIMIIQNMNIIAYTRIKPVSNHTYPTLYHHHLEKEMFRHCWRRCRCSPVTPSTLWWKTSAMTRPEQRSNVKD